VDAGAAAGMVTCGGAAGCDSGAVVALFLTRTDPAHALPSKSGIRPVR